MKEGRLGEAAWGWEGRMEMGEADVQGLQGDSQKRSMRQRRSARRLEEEEEEEDTNSQKNKNRGHRCNKTNQIMVVFFKTNPMVHHEAGMYV